MKTPGSSAGTRFPERRRGISLPGPPGVNPGSALNVADAVIIATAFYGRRIPQSSPGGAGPGLENDLGLEPDPPVVAGVGAGVEGESLLLVDS